MLADLAAWLADTSISRSFGATLWVVPFSQSLHILAIAAVMASAWILSFRLMGLAGRAETIAQTYARYAPWIWRALVVLLLTGLVLIIGEPARQLTNAAFLTKMVLLIAAVLLTAVLQLTLRRKAGDWDRPEGPPLAAKALALLQLSQWLAIAVAGRWIAYAEYG
jgi:magnesium-transporting ATPase (P-type)